MTNAASKGKGPPANAGSTSSLDAVIQSAAPLLVTAGKILDASWPYVEKAFAVLATGWKVETQIRMASRMASMIW